MITTKTIRLDVTKKYTEPIYLVQYEVNARILDIYLSAGSLPINLTGASVVFYAKKPDGTILFNNCKVVNAASGHVSYTVTSQTCAAAGDLKCWILVIKGGAELRSLEFAVTVKPSEDDTEAIESTSEFTALDEALAAVASGIESGVFTPTIGGDTTDGTISYTIQEGYYVKTGKKVSIWLRLAIDDVTVAASGNLRIRGLPYASLNRTNMRISGTSIVSGVSWGESKTQASAYLGPNQSAILIYGTQSGYAPAVVSADAVGNGDYFVISMEYPI